MSASSWSTGSHAHTTDTPDSLDTALPPVQSQDLSLTRRRPAVRPDSSLIIGNFRGMQQQRPGMPFHHSSNMIARGPSMHRRTESTLKTVMRKIFHRKRRSQTDDLEEDPMESYYTSSGKQQARRSEHTNRQETYVALSHNHGSKGHSPLQKDFRPTLMDLNKLEPMPIHRRRATLPSLVFSDDNDDNESHPLNIPMDREHHTSNILTPDTGAKETLHARRARRNKRRSRSTNSLRRKANEHRMSPVQWTRRSAEITYLGSPAFGAVSDSELSCRPPTRTTIASGSKPVDADADTHSLSETEQQTEVESIPPSVGNLVHTMQHDDNLTLEQRVTTLEVKLIDLEFAIARLQDKRGDASPTARSKKSLTPDTARPQKNKHSGHSSPFSPATLGQGLTPSSHPSHQFAEGRPASTSTVRPHMLHRSHTHQPPPSPSKADAHAQAHIGISIEQYNSLVSLLHKEQSARRNLEGEMSSMRDDIQQLQQMARDSRAASTHTSTGTGMGTGIGARSSTGTGTGTMYPIPSTDSQEAAQRMRPFMESPQSNYTTTTMSSGAAPRAETIIPHYDQSYSHSHNHTPSELGLGVRRLERRIEFAGMI